MTALRSVILAAMSRSTSDSKAGHCQSTSDNRPYVLALQQVAVVSHAFQLTYSSLLLLLLGRLASFGMRLSMGLKRLRTGF